MGSTDRRGSLAIVWHMTYRGERAHESKRKSPHVGDSGRRNEKWHETRTDNATSARAPLCPLRVLGKKWPPEGSLSIVFIPLAALTLSRTHSGGRAGAGERKRKAERIGSLIVLLGRTSQLTHRSVRDSEKGSMGTCIIGAASGDPHCLAVQFPFPLIRVIPSNRSQAAGGAPEFGIQLAAYVRARPRPRHPDAFGWFCPVPTFGA